MEKTYYEKFGIKETASALDIKIAYRKLAIKYHPDKNEGDKKSENIFKQVNNIYETLSDVDSRRQYDAELKRMRGAERQYTSTNQEYQRQQDYQQTNSSPRKEDKYTYRKTTSSTKYAPFEKDFSGFTILSTLGIIVFAIYFTSNTSKKSIGNNPSILEYDSNLVNSNYNNENSPSTGEINFGSSTPKMKVSKDSVNLDLSKQKVYEQVSTSNKGNNCQGNSEPLIFQQAIIHHKTAFPDAAFQVCTS
jgi:curved DNA-binding protein CbpA